MYLLESNYFAIESILTFEAILSASFMCLQIDIFATILVVMIDVVDSAAAFKCNGYGFIS